MTGVFDSPTVRLCLNVDWISHIDGVLARLAEVDAWEGTDAQKTFAVGQIEQLLSKLATIQECNTVTMPVGSIVMFGGNSLPDGFLRCDGAEILRADYLELFAVIGETYGAGNGVSTFRLPDLRARFPLGEGLGVPPTARSRGESGGAEQHTLTVQEMPAHAHAYNQGVSTAAEYTTPGTKSLLRSSTGWVDSGSVGGGEAHNNMPPFLVVSYMIYAGSGAVQPTCSDCATPSSYQVYDLVPLDTNVVVTANEGVYTSGGKDYLRVTGDIIITFPAPICFKGIRVGYKRVSNAGNNWSDFATSASAETFQIQPPDVYDNTHIDYDYLLATATEISSLTLSKAAGGTRWYIEYVEVLVCP